ncbi:MAG: phenylalanine 4-monooxygenase [Alphaproteobacteria bacterium]
MQQAAKRTSDMPVNPDHTIDQDWEGYTAAEHARWDALFQRQSGLLPGRACDAFVTAMNTLTLSDSGIPHFGRLSDRLERLTGWRVVAVPGLVPDAVFFDHLANRRFPAGAFIRAADQMDYIEEPDVFHDVFGHVPLLANPVFADYMQAYGNGGLRADGLGVLHHLARLYWYTVEFGLVKSDDGLRIFGAGIVSSATETIFALDDPSPNRVGFDLVRLLRTNYRIDDFQQTYFVIESFERLLEDTAQDFGPIYQRIGRLDDLDPPDLLPEDVVLARGTQAYFTEKVA